MLLSWSPFIYIKYREKKGDRCQGEFKNEKQEKKTRKKQTKNNKSSKSYIENYSSQLHVDNIRM